MAGSIDCVTITPRALRVCDIHLWVLDISKEDSVLLDGANKVKMFYRREREREKTKAVELFVLLLYQL